MRKAEAPKDCDGACETMKVRALDLRCAQMRRKRYCKTDYNSNFTVTPTYADHHSASCAAFTANAAVADEMNAPSAVANEKTTPV
mmetsp:Transcript_8761/g.22961  ORF Transcript_8761/g.22961 Transcript_8761/m.22961 type:complete len:85 (+) Transcript_8761:36-290(+)